MLYKLEAVVIRHMDYGEGHKIISLYSKETGKMSVMARGAKKLRSRHGAVTQLFTYGQFVVYKAAGMGSLNAAEIYEAHQELKTDLMKGAYAAYLAEMVDKLTGEMEPNPVLFQQLLAALNCLAEGKEAAVVAHIMELNMLMLSGYAPELDQCASCGRDNGEMAFSIAAGGILCQGCSLQRDSQTIGISPGTLKLLRLFRQFDLRRLGQIELKPVTRGQLKQCMGGLMDHYLDAGRWKSRSFLDQMDKYGF